MKRKGISLVALIITIIVLIVITGAVVLTGVKTPQNARLAIFYNNIATVQEAVSLKIVNNMSKYSKDTDKNVNVFKWEGVINNFVPSNGAPNFTNSDIIINNEIPVLQIDQDMVISLSIDRVELGNYYISEKAVVYYYNQGLGFAIDDGTRYYNRTTIVEGDIVILPVVAELSGDWEEIELPPTWTNEDVLAIQNGDGDIVPIPDGFVLSSLAGEYSVDDGLVIYEGTTQVTNVDTNGNSYIDAQETKNQFVWVPILDVSSMVGIKDSKNAGIIYFDEDYWDFDLNYPNMNATNNMEPVALKGNLRDGSDYSNYGLTNLVSVLYNDLNGLNTACGTSYATINDAIAVTNIRIK